MKKIERKNIEKGYKSPNRKDKLKSKQKMESE